MVLEGALGSCRCPGGSGGCSGGHEGALGVLEVSWEFWRYPRGPGGALGVLEVPWGLGSALGVLKVSWGVVPGWGDGTPTYTTCIVPSQPLLTSPLKLTTTLTSPSEPPSL